MWGISKPEVTVIVEPEVARRDCKVGKNNVYLAL